MCEASAYWTDNGDEKLLLEAVDTIEPSKENGYRIVSVFGEEKFVTGRIKSISLVDHRILFGK